MNPVQTRLRRARRWFTADDESSLGDFWRVYDDVERQGARRPAADPEAARAHPGEAARAGDFQAYETVLRRQARRCAELGLGFDALERAYGRLAGDVGPHLVRAYPDPTRLLGVFDAMTRLMARELSVLGAEYRSAQPIAHVGDGVIATDAQGAVVRMNAAAEKMVGWTLDEARGRALTEVFLLRDPDSGELLDSQIDEVLRDGKVIVLPRHPALVARDGASKCTVSESMAPIEGEGGAIEGVVLVFRDQNVERAHGQALEASQAQTLAIIEASLDAVVTMDDEGLVVDFNGAAERMFGYDGYQVVGGRFADLVLAPVARDVHTRVLTDPRVLLGHREEMVGMRSDGTEFPIEIATVRIQSGGAATFTCFVRDLTAAKGAEAALEQSRRQLRALAGRVQAAREEERTRIARELHDELGQQLTAIRMDLGWLTGRQKGAPPEILERVQAITALVDATFKMVRRLATELRPGILDDLGLAAAIEWQAREFEGRSGIRVDVDAPNGFDATDPRRATAIFRIFQEILTNVGRHSGARRVRARLSEEGGGLRFEVSDDGRGIRPEESANLDSLGLLGMRERATLLGGSLRIEAGARGGTVVTVTLPADRS